MNNSLKFSKSNENEWNLIRKSFAELKKFKGSECFPHRFLCHNKIQFYRKILKQTS